MTTRLHPELYKFTKEGTVAQDFHLLHPSVTPSLLETLRKRSVAAKSHAYCPYSNFRVGATLITTSGEYIDGANIENASYPVGICAERVALGKAIYSMVYDDVHGKEVRDFKKFIALAIAADTDTPTSPCGMCRQFIREFCHLDMPVLMFNKDGDFVVLCVEQVMPYFPYK